MKSSLLSLPAAGTFLRTKALMGIFLIGCACEAKAATTAWMDGSGDFAWGTAGNWAAGSPSSTTGALFDIAGAGTVSVSGTVTAQILQFGNADVASSFTIGSTAGGGTIALTGAGYDFGSTAATALTIGTGATFTTPILSYTGTGNATQTINSNIVIGSGVNSADIMNYGITNSSNGNLVFNGTITSGNTGTGPSYLTLNNSGTGNVTFNGSISLGTNSRLMVQTAVGTTVTLAGSNSLDTSGTNYSGISLGIDNTTANGNLKITKGSAIGTAGTVGARLNVLGSAGAIQVDTAVSGSNMTTGFTFLVSGRAAGDESLTHIENVSGNNNFASVGLGHNSSDVATNPAAPTSYYIKSDAGLMTIANIQGLQVSNSGATNYQQVYLYGSGNGVVKGGIYTKNTPTTNALTVVKDGAGIWAVTGSTSASASTTYNVIGTKVQGGTYLMDTPSNINATGAFTVNSSLGSGNAVLGGVGFISAPVTVAGGGAINPGDINGFNGATSSIGTLTVAGTGSVTVGDSSSSGSLIFEINTSTSAADLLVTPTLTLTNATLSVTDLGSATLTAGTVLKLVQYTTLNGTFANFLNSTTTSGGDTLITVGSNTYQLDYDYIAGGNNYIALEAVASVPEPKTYAFLLMGAALLFLRVRAVRQES